MRTTGRERNIEKRIRWKERERRMPGERERKKGFMKESTGIHKKNKTREVKAKRNREKVNLCLWVYL